MRVFWMVAVALVACAGQHPRTPTAQEIVHSMALTYQRATTYADHGVETTVGDANTRTGTFDTAFARPDSLRFEKHGPFGHLIAWASHGSTHVFAGNSIEDVKSLDAVRSSIPRLLLGGGPSVAELARVRIDGAEPIDGHPCWRVTGATPAGALLTLWIDQGSYVLRQTFERERMPASISPIDDREMPAYDNETTTHYQPVLGARIDAAQLRGVDASELKPRGQIPWLGVALDGNRLTHLVADGPSEHSGLRVGDQFLWVDGEPIANAEALRAHMSTKVAGAIAKVSIVRAGVPVDVDVAIGNRLDYLDLGAQLRGKPAPALTAELAGHPTVIVFVPTTAMECIDCRLTTSFLSALQDKYAPRGLRVIQISSEPDAVLRQVAGDRGLHHQLVHDDGFALADAYRAGDPGTAVLIDAAGIVWFSEPGLAGLEVMIQRMLDDR